MPDTAGEPTMRWMYRREGGNVVARREPVRPESGWVFDERSFAVINPVRDLMICDISRGRDDFSHAGIRLSDKKKIFFFEIGRPYDRALTTDEESGNPHCDDACVFLIVDRRLSEDERQLVLEWLQAKEDGIVARARRAGKSRKHQLMVLHSVSGIEGY